MGKAAKIAKDREMNGTSAPQPAAAPHQAAPSGAPDAFVDQTGRPASREQLIAALNHERNKLQATEAQRNANMNQNAQLIASINELQAVIQQLNNMIAQKDARIAELEAKPAVPSPAAAGKAQPHQPQPKAETAA